MNDILEQIREDAFNEELSKIATYKTVQTIKSILKSQRISSAARGPRSTAALEKAISPTLRPDRAGVERANIKNMLRYAGRPY